MKKQYLFLLLYILAFLTGSSYANCAEEKAVTANLISNTKAIIPGHSFKLGVELIMQPGWHTYYKEPGDAGFPTKIVWQLPAGFKTNNLYWQKPTRFDEAGIVTYGYTNKTLIATEVIPPENLDPSKDIKLSAQIKWLSCKDTCVPGQAEAQIHLPISTHAGSATDNLSINTKEFDSANIPNISLPAITPSSAVTPAKAKSSTSQILTYFAFALIGGFLLNFMPCVLPVVAIKILSLLEKSDKDSTRKTVIAFSSGILSSFLLLGLIVVGLQAAGQNIGWGFQFQQPIFLMVMSSLVLLFGLSLFGLFDFSFSLGQEGINDLADKEGVAGDFFKGVLATVLSTPCTAPFLGTALGFAFVESWIVTLTIFLSIGIGMCLPYLVLIFAPQYLKFLPKPGDWMTKLKESFGFILLATVIWLVSILYYQVPAALVIAFMYFLLSVAFSIWLLHSFTNLASSPKRLLIVRSIAALIVLCAAYFFIYINKDLFIESANPSGSRNSSSLSMAETTSFDQNKLDQALSSGKTVFLDFTAKWCLTCQLNENTVLNTKEVQDKIRSLNVLLLKVDWTKQDPKVTKLIRKFERSGVPLYVIYSAKHPDKPIILPELITKEMILSKLDEAGPSLK
jgi:thiol:disulfide interchange protein